MNGSCFRRSHLAPERHGETSQSQNGQQRAENRGQAGRRIDMAELQNFVTARIRTEVRRCKNELEADFQRKLDALEESFMHALREIIAKHSETTKQLAALVESGVSQKDQQIISWMKGVLSQLHNLIRDNAELKKGCSMMLAQVKELEKRFVLLGHTSSLELLNNRCYGADFYRPLTADYVPPPPTPPANFRPQPPILREDSPDHGAPLPFNFSYEFYALPPIAHQDPLADYPEFSLNDDLWHDYKANRGSGNGFAPEPIFNFNGNVNHDHNNNSELGRLPEEDFPAVREEKLFPTPELSEAEDGDNGEYVYVNDEDYKEEAHPVSEADQEEEPEEEQEEASPEAIAELDNLLKGELSFIKDRIVLKGNWVVVDQKAIFPLTIFLEKIATIPWKVFPDDYVVRCGSDKCGFVQPLQMRKDGCSVSCSKCSYRTLIEYPKPGFSYHYCKSCRSFFQSRCMASGAICNGKKCRRVQGTLPVANNIIRRPFLKPLKKKKQQQQKKAADVTSTSRNSPGPSTSQ